MKYQLKIADRLYYLPEEQTKGKEIIAALKEMELELPRIEKKEETAREQFWQASEALRKGYILNVNPGKIQQLHANLYAAQDALQGPRRDLSERWQQRNAEYDAVTQPIRADIIRLIEKNLDEIQTLKKVRKLGTQKRLVDDRDWGHDQKFHSIEHNFDSVESIITLLVGFRNEARAGMKQFSHEEIIDRCRKFENIEINEIDVDKFEKEEIGQSRFQELRDAKML